MKGNSRTPLITLNSAFGVDSFSDSPVNDNFPVGFSQIASIRLKIEMKVQLTLFLKLDGVAEICFSHGDGCHPFSVVWSLSLKIIPKMNRLTNSDQVLYHKVLSNCLYFLTRFFHKIFFTNNS